MATAGTPAPGPSWIPVPIEASGRVHLHLPGDLPPGPAPALLAVHGYGQPPEEMFAYARRVAPNAVVLAPEGPSAFYADPRVPTSRGGRVARGWVAEADRTEEDRRNTRHLLAALEAVQRLRPLDPRRTACLGYSQGVGVATIFLCRHPERAAALVGLAGGVPTAERNALGALAGKDVLWVTGRRDRAYPPEYAEVLVAALRAAGARTEARVLEVGHGLAAPAEDDVRAWLAPRLA